MAEPEAGAITDPEAVRNVRIEAPPERVWALVGDPRRTPEWSPVCHRIDWHGAADVPPAVGDRFVGHNRLNGFRWHRECRITAYARPAEIAYSTFFKGNESTRWRYRLTPTADGAATDVEEAYQVVSIPRWVAFLRRLPGGMAKTRRDLDRNLSESLERLKRAAEAETETETETNAS